MQSPKFPLINPKPPGAAGPPALAHLLISNGDANRACPRRRSINAKPALPKQLRALKPRATCQPLSTEPSLHHSPWHPRLVISMSTLARGNSAPTASPGTSAAGKHTDLALIKRNKGKKSSPLPIPSPHPPGLHLPQAARGAAVLAQRGVGVKEDAKRGA